MSTGILLLIPIMVNPRCPRDVEWQVRRFWLDDFAYPTCWSSRLINGYLNACRKIRDTLVSSSKLVKSEEASVMVDGSYEKRSALARPLNNMSIRIFQQLGWMIVHQVKVSVYHEREKILIQSGRMKLSFIRSEASNLKFEMALGLNRAQSEHENIWYNHESRFPRPHLTNAEIPLCSVGLSEEEASRLWETLNNLARDEPIAYHDFMTKQLQHLESDKDGEVVLNQQSLTSAVPAVPLFVPLPGFVVKTFI